MITAVIDSIVTGILTGALYGIIAVGISLIFGVMRVINFAHGEFVMLSMYGAWMLSLIGVDPLVSLPLLLIPFLMLGAGVYSAFIKPIIRAPLLSQVLLTFGISLLIASSAQQIWTTSFRSSSRLTVVP